MNAESTIVTAFRRDGFAVVPQLFDAAELSRLREHYMEMRAAGPWPGDFAGVDLSSSDPLRKFARMIHMHRFDQASRAFLLDERLGKWLEAFSGYAPYAVQTMLYFKPPGARGQALHQDNFYLRATPGTCFAAWLALDDADEENGCMQLVPGSHELPLLCVESADTAQSFTNVKVPVPPSLSARPVVMKAGDVLFFHGSAIHGSFPNKSRDRFRRALIGHYISGEATSVADGYQPVLAMNGDVVSFSRTAEGGPCGVWEGDPKSGRVRMVEGRDQPSGLSE